MASQQSISQFWKALDVPKLQKQLDATATDLAARQDETEISRKKLVELSREFKQTADDEVKKRVSTLLKSFQQEIDSLSKRSKAAEAAFLDLYKKLIEMPDPVTTLLDLEKKAQRVNDLEVDCANLNSTIEEYQSEFKEVKNQEVTIRQLREKVRAYEEQMQETIEAKCKEKEDSMKQFYDERERQFQEAGVILSSKLKDAERQVSNLDRDLNRAQEELLELKSRSDERTAARSEEINMTLTDLERATQRAENAERQVELLQQQLADFKADVGDSTASDLEPANAKLLELEISTKDRQINQLLEDLRLSQGKLSEIERVKSVEIGNLEKQLATMKHELGHLEEKLNEQSDYNDVKRELGVLKSVEFGSLLEKDTKAGPGVRPGVASPVSFGPTKSLEVLLLEKNKSLESQNTTLRQTKKELEACATSSSSHKRKANSDSSFERSTGSPILSNQPQPQQLPSERCQSLVEKLWSFIDCPPQPSTSANTGLSNRVTTPTPPNSSCHKMPSVKIEHISLTPDDWEGCENVPNGVSGENVRLMYKLQSMVNAKAEGLGDSHLDTFQIATRCKHLLTIYNIGQRLFAKTVLNQSQGALSELLAKPKPWHRCTQKGKASFRKIYAWITNDEAIATLRALSPKKASSGTDINISGRSSQVSSSSQLTEKSLSGNGSGKCNTANSQGNEDSTHARVAAILSKAQSQISAEQRQLYNPPTNYVEPDLSKIVRRSPVSCPSNDSEPTFNDFRGSMGRCDVISGRSYRYKHDDIPKEQIVEIYEREMAKLKALEGAPSGGARNRPRVSKKSPSPGVSVPAVSMPPEPKTVESCNNVEPKAKCSEPAATTGSSARTINSNGSLNYDPRMTPTPIRPKSDLERSNCNPLAIPTSTAVAVVGHSHAKLNFLSPALSTNGSSPPPALTGTKALKAILPPVTQEQFDLYPLIETEAVVKQVKDFLCQYSISQRSFGELVLGLSQGSVSDLLSRPKPWYMLTQKGREPFIRMQLFLDDPQAVEKMLSNKSLVMAVGLTTNPPLATPSSKPSSKELRSSPMVIGGTKCLAPDSKSKGHDGSPSQTPSLSPADNAVVGELSSGIEDLDTQKIAEKIKDYLASFNISQKVFGEAVLGLSQGTVSELLSKPKKWSTLEYKARFPYVRMHLWLDDVNRGSKLAAFKDSKDRRQNEGATFSTISDIVSSSDDAITTTTAQVPDSTTDEPTSSSNSELEPPPTKRARVVIDSEQKEILLAAFERDSYPAQETLQNLALELNLSFRTVSNWFHNRRMRTKCFVSTSEQFGPPRRDKTELPQSGGSEDEGSLSAPGLGTLVENLKYSEKECERLKNKSEQQELLVAKLEQDLMTLESRENDFPQDPTTEVLSAKRSLERTSNSESILSIITSQRDRLRARVSDLDQQNTRQQEHLSLLQSEVERMKEDNVKLYEKIKFLQSYSSSAATKVPLPSDAETKYQTEYESSLDPFRKFNLQESQRKYLSLRPHEKATLGLVLYRLAHTEICHLDMAEECKREFSNHMESVHGEKLKDIN